MGDAIVTFLAEKLARLLVKEAKLFSDVNDKVKSLGRELVLMKAFLNSPQRKRKEHDAVVNLIRDIAHEAEDVIDAYVADMIKQRRRTIIKVVFHGVDHALMLRYVSVKIEKINSTINEIFINKEKYNIEGERRNREIEHIRIQRSEVEEKKVAGFVHDSKVVIEQLMSSGSRLEVVYIVGMGGLGKTTLARKVYNNKSVKNMFPCRAWGYVSNDYRPREFFLSLLKCLSPDKYNDSFKRMEDNEELKIKVRECLNRSKYLVVVDDVWQIENWNEVKDVFLDDRKGSRILVTTRSTNFASHTSQILSYSLPFLSKQKSMELLLKKVFPGQKSPSYPESLRLIAESCDGLPLAIIAMAEVLANKSPSQWSIIKDHVDWFLGKDITLNNVLKLSYDNLPEWLKPCFLYFGMFPEHYNIPVKQLIRLWISEGLLMQEISGSTNSPEPEFIAQECLRELVERSLVQVVHRTSDGGIKTCRIHNVLRHLCISESREDRFFEVSKKIDSQTNNNCLRRLSFHGTLLDFSSNTISDYSVSATRSLLCFNQEVSSASGVNSDHHLKWLLKNCKLARVLDLGRMNVNLLPTCLEKLIHLRYLRINSKNLKTIPASICELWNLETLDLRGSHIKSLPDELWRLKQLRHLLMLGPVKLPNMPSSESETMQNLQTLSDVSLDPHTASLFDNGTFPRLTKLILHYERLEDTYNPRVQLQSLQHLSHLQKLKLIGTTEIPKIAADVFPSSITKITITKFGFFNSSAMKTLGKLPNLHVLKLSSQKNNASFDLHCVTGGFPKLQVFVMVGIKVKGWRLNKGSMPHVLRVVIRNCKLLYELPKELWSLKTLCEVNVSRPTTELAKTLQNLEVKNGCKLVVYPRNQVKN